MKFRAVNLKLLAVWLVICIGGGALIAPASGMPFWGGAAIVAVVLLVNGVVAEVEDRASGGFLNPDEKSE